MYPARMCRLRNAIVKFENFPREVILGGDYPVIFHFLNVLTPSFFHSSALIQICWNCSMLASEHAPMYALWYRWGEAWTSTITEGGASFCSSHCSLSANPGNMVTPPLK